MSTGSTNLLLSALMFAAGIGIPIMAALNARLGAEIASPWGAGFILCMVGAVVCGIAMALFGLPKAGWFAAPLMYYAGGLLVAFYILSVTVSAPRIGVANAIFLVLVGQIVAAALIDHFGLFGARVSPLSVQRGIGIVVMAAGAYLARNVA